MNVTLCKQPFEYIIIDDTYTDEELKLIFLELDFFTLSGKLMGAEHTGTAKDFEGRDLKSNKGLFLDDAFSNRDFSNILNLNRKIYEATSNEPSVILKQLHRSNNDSTLVSYYENNSHYKAHDDLSYLTSLTYLYKQPKKFQGGELVLVDYGLVFEPWFNRTYIIPSVVRHEVTKVTMEISDCNKGMGRYCITNFICTI